MLIVLSNEGETESNTMMRHNTRSQTGCDGRHGLEIMSNS